MTQIEIEDHSNKMKRLYKNVLFLNVANEFLFLSSLPNISVTGISIQNVVDARKLSRMKKDAQNKEDLYHKYIQIIGDKEMLTRKNNNSNQYKAFHC